MPKKTLDASLNTSANVFVFGDFNDHHKNWLNYSGGTDRLDELCYNFVIISYDFIQMVNFPTWIPVAINSPALLDIFLSSEAGIC